MKQMPLGDILKALPQPVADRVLDMVENSPLEDRAFTDDLKRLLKPHAQTLLDIGVVADYLAYVLLAIRQQYQLKKTIGGNPALN